MNTWNWFAWLGAALICLSATRNPLYLILILLALMIVFLAWSGQGDHPQAAVVSPLKFSAFVVCTTALFNALTSHFGDTVLFNIPGRIPLISGAFTLEALTYGFINGLALSAMLTTFTIINIVLPTASLLRLAPRAFYPLTIIISIALTFLPSTRRQIDLIIEAQKVRGHRVAGLRDWLPLFMPLLIGALERSLQLAETMTARGFASATEPLNIKTRLLLLSGMILAVGGWAASLVVQAQSFGYAAVTLGLLLISSVIWQVGRKMPRTLLKNEPWTFKDGLVLLANLGLIVYILFWIGPEIKSSLYYQPYPRLGLPAFSSIVGAWIITLSIPAIFAPRQRT